MEPLRDPLEKEDESLPSYAGALKHQEEVNTFYKKHVADKIRKELEIPSATDDEAMTVLHGTQVPDSTPEEFKSIIDDVYGNDFKIPKMPLVDFKKPNVIGGILADLPINYYRDLIGLPQGAFEIVRGVGKMGKGQLEGIEQTAFSGTPPSAENSYTQEGKEDIEKGFQHFVRGGAFAAATALTGGLAGGSLSTTGKGFLGTLATEAGLGGAWLGAYRGIREAGKPEADISHIAQAAGTGTLEGAAFGAGAGLVHGTIRGYKLQKERAAQTLKEQHRAEFLAEEKSKQESLAKQARKKAQESGADIDALETEAPIGQIPTPKPQPVLNQAQGTVASRTGPLWQVTIDRGKGNAEVHTLVGADRKEAEKFAEIFAKHRNAKVVGSIEPQLERRQTDVPPLVGLRKGELSNMSLEDIVKAIPHTNDQQRIALARELDRRPLGTSPYSRENPVDITKNSSWTSYLIKLREKVKNNPKDIALKDELYRAEQNFEQFKKIKAAKIETSIRNGAADEIPQVRKMSSSRLLKKYGHRFPGEEASKVRAYVLAELRSMVKETKPHVKENESIIKDLTAEEAKVNELDFIPTQEMNVEDLEGLSTNRGIPITKIPPAEIVTPRKPLPSQTLLIGRGMNGQVRVEFPDQTHADLYSLLGRSKKLMTDPNIPSSEKKILAERLKFSREKLAKDLNLTGEELWKLAKQYRERISEFVKGHPTYGESGVTLKAPRLEERIDQASLDPEQLRKLYEASLTGNKEEVDKILSSSYQFKYKPSSKFEPFLLVHTRAPAVSINSEGNTMKIVNFDPILRRSIPEHQSFIKKFAEMPDYEKLADDLGAAFDHIKDTLGRFNRKYDESEFGGFSTYNHFGMNVNWGKASQIYLNPWRIGRVIEKMRDRSTPEEIDELWARLIYDYLLHEITHQIVRFKNTTHELKGLKTEVGRAFDRELRKNMERMASQKLEGGGQFPTGSMPDDRIPFDILIKKRIQSSTSNIQRMVIEHDKLLNPESR